MSKKITTEDFIQKAKKVHVDRYDYSLVDYVDSKTNIKIICREHNYIFSQSPNKHLNGRGCPKCVGKNKTTEDFINKAKDVHKNKYEYSLTNYINSQTKVKIICSIHGVFEQDTSNHLSGQGCPVCGLGY